tara:strand:- start:9121 stop:9543 length:423 start_codon:yes stop_codon:yes gene_type:complete
MDFDLICDEFDDCENDPFNDIDNDGVCGDLDMCDGFDDNIDIDNDGIPDGCDNCISTNACFIPTGFSPNGDGINDVWLLCCNEFNNAEVSVYNRWGSLFFIHPTINQIGMVNMSLKSCLQQIIFICLKRMPKKHIKAELH